MTWLQTLISVVLEYKPQDYAQWPPCNYYGTYATSSALTVMVPQIGYYEALNWKL